MSFSVPTARPAIQLAQYTRGRTIFAADWQKLAEANHFHFSRTRSKIAGLVYEDNPWSTTSTSYVTADDNSGRDFATWSPIIELPRRHWDGTSFDVAIHCEIYGRNVDVTWTMITLDTNTNFATKTDVAIDSASWQHATGIQTLSWASAHIGGSTANDLRQFSVSPQARRNTFAATGDIWAINFHSIVLTASQIPPSES